MNENLDAYDAETAALVLQAEIELTRLQAIWMDHKAEAKIAKKIVEEQQQNLRDLIREREKSRAQPTLFE